MVVLAAGRGTRLRKADEDAALTAEQAQVAATGLKAMVPMGRPFLDFLLTNIAEAGYRQVCLVIGPDHQIVRDHYRQVVPERLAISFAVQHEPRGTADAITAASDFVDRHPFVLLNGDNYYAPEVLAEMRQLDGCGVAGFQRRVLCQQGNVPRERIARFALLMSRPDGTLEKIIEKPDPAFVSGLPEPVLVNMNCWRFSPAIFSACRAIEPSPRGEYELPDAVTYAMRRCQISFRILTTDTVVLDLSSRSDIEQVAKRISRRPVRF